MLLVDLLLLLKKRLAEACIMSRITYGIQLWGPGSTPSVVRRIQVVQNLAMCWATNLNKFTRTKNLLTKLNWLSIHQLIYYHSFLIIYKITSKKTPRRNFRHLENGPIFPGRIDLTKRRLSKTVLSIYKNVDPAIRNGEKISVFKKRIKIWIKKNIRIHSDINPD